jgi:hypothetical protein
VDMSILQLAEALGLLVAAALAAASVLTAVLFGLHRLEVVSVVAKSQRRQ